MTRSLSSLPTWAHSQWPLSRPHLIRVLTLLSRESKSGSSKGGKSLQDNLSEDGKAEASRSASLFQKQQKGLGASVWTEVFSGYPDYKFLQDYRIMQFWH